MSTSLKRPFLMFICRPKKEIIDSEVSTVARLGNLTLGTDLIPIDVLTISDSELAAINYADYSGIFISGSHYSFSSPEENHGGVQDALEQQTLSRSIEIAKCLLDGDYPTFGLCFGLQALCIAGGGTLTPAYPEDLSSPLISVLPTAYDDPIMRECDRTFQAFVGHHDSIGAMPHNSVLLAKSDSCPIQMIRIQNNIYGTQFHPEIDKDGMKIRIDLYSGVYFDPVAARETELMRSAANVDQANRLITAFVRTYAQ